jgi:spore germination protein YaaH
MRWSNYLFFASTFTLGVLMGIGVLIVLGKNVPSFNQKFLSPLGTNPDILATKIPSKKPVYGFLPYWTLGTAQIQYHLIDHLIYFGIALEPDGRIKTNDGDNIDIGWYRLSGDQVRKVFEQAKEFDVKVGVAVTAFDNGTIGAILTNSSYQDRAIENILTLVEDYDLDSINIDFEFDTSKTIPRERSMQYSQFIGKLKSEVNQIYPEIEISVDLYANSFIYDNPYDVISLADNADKLMLMGYDFHRASSPKSGPVAPLKDKKDVSITKSLAAALEKEIDPDKIVLAMPFYGYEWRTTSEDYKSPTYPGSGAIATYKRVRQLIEIEGLEELWDQEAMSPWIVYEVDNAIHQIYYENDRSLGLKFQLIDQVQLGGGAIWALGYEGEDAPIWHVIENWRRRN